MSQEASSNAQISTDHSSTGRWTSKQMFVMFMLLLIMITNYLDRLIMTIIQEPIKLEMGLTDLQLGLLTGPAFGILYGVSAIPIARLADRYNRINILSLSLAAWSGFTMLCAATSSYIQIFISRMAVGVSEGGGAPSVYSLIGDYFAPRQRGFATAVLGMSTPIAGFIAPLVGAYVAQQYGWRWAFVALGVPGILIAIMFKLTVVDPREAGSVEKSEATPEPVKAGKFLSDMKWLFTNKAFISIFIASMMAGAVMISTLLFTGSFLLRKFNMTLQEAGLVLSVGLGVGGLCGALLGGWASDRFSGANGRSYMFVPAVGAAGAGSLYFVAYSVPTWEMAAVFVIAATVFQTMKNGPNFAAIQTLVPANMRATASAVLLLGISMIGSSIGPPMVGVISDYIANLSFPQSLGVFEQQCYGASELADELKSACNKASADGLQAALKTIAALYGIPTILYFIAGYQLRLNMDSKS